VQNLEIISNIKICRASNRRGNEFSQMKSPPFRDPDVKAVFDSYPKRLRTPLLRLRRLIFACASRYDGVGEVVETLKWGQAAYLTEKPKSGSTIRLGTLKGQENGYAMFFHCQTTLVSTFREIYPETLSFQGKRAILFSLDDEIPQDAVAHCIGLALTYHSGQRA
jgi:Domain of unknown function (DU1801)